MTCDGHERALLQRLHQQQLSRQLCDVRLRVGGAERFAHRAVLCAASPYFQAMFTGGLAESQQTEVDILGVVPSVFDALLVYIYSGRSFASHITIKCHKSMNNMNCHDMHVSSYFSAKNIILCVCVRGYHVDTG